MKVARTQMEPADRGKWRFPIATTTMLLISIVVTCSRFAVPGLTDTLRRDPAALEHGEWWRVITPLLIQPDPWAATLGVWVTLLFIGATVEKLFGTSRWIVLYGIGAIVGEAAGYSWQPHGAGGSVAVAGLLGGFLAWCLVRPTPWPSKTVAWLVLGTACLDTWLRDIHGLPLLAGALAGAVMVMTIKSGEGEPIRIAPHLSLSWFRCPAGEYVYRSHDGRDAEKSASHPTKESKP